MNYFVGIFRLLFGTGAMVAGSVGLNQHFGGLSSVVKREWIVSLYFETY